MIVAERPERGVRLLQQFVAGVIYDVAALRPVLDLVALRTPVVLLGAGPHDGERPTCRFFLVRHEPKPLSRLLGSLNRVRQ